MRARRDIPAGRPGGLSRPLVRGRSRRSHHRRRRWSAAAASAVVLVAFLALNGGSARSHRVTLALNGGIPAVGPLAEPSGGAVDITAAALQRAAIEHTRAETPYVRIAGAQHRELALTFDDGPGPYTPEVLHVLERTNVPATFFEVGMMERYFHASTSHMVRDGDAIGDHTQNHPDLSLLSPAAQRTQLLDQAASVEAWGAQFPSLFRPPYGRWNAATLQLLRRLRMLMVLWTVDTGDYLRPGVKAIVQRAVAGARPGAIILLHDAGGYREQTVQALPRIISALRRRGYRLVTVPQLLLDNPAPAVQPAGGLGGGG